MTSLQYKTFLAIFGLQNANQLLRLYNPDVESPIRALSDLLTDMIFHCPSRSNAAKVSKFSPFFLYSFDFLSGFSDR